jgi:hypothetical protein
MFVLSLTSKFHSPNFVMLVSFVGFHLVLWGFFVSHSLSFFLLCNTISYQSYVFHTMVNQIEVRDNAIAITKDTQMVRFFNLSLCNSWFCYHVCHT